jgi:hypothetical protein
MDTYTIYRIRDNETHETYIGSTKNTLEWRIYYHKKRKNCKSMKILKNNNYVCSALLQVKCNKETALWLERFSMNNHYKVINQLRSITTKEERLRERKEYHKKQRALKQTIYHCPCGKQLKITNSRESTIKRHEEGIRHINRIKKNELKDKRL